MLKAKDREQNKESFEISTISFGYEDFHSDQETTDVSQVKWVGFLMRDGFFRTRDLYQSSKIPVS
jgi:hypothetical protein